MTGGRFVASDRGAFISPADQLAEYAAQPDEPAPAFTAPLIDLALIHMDELMLRQFTRWYETLQRN
jgi:hypothetical protein